MIVIFFHFPDLVAQSSAFAEVHFRGNEVPLIFKWTSAHYRVEDEAAINAPIDINNIEANNINKLWAYKNFDVAW